MVEECGHHRRTCDIVRHADLRGDDVERLDKVVVGRVRDAEEQVNHEQHFDRGTDEALLERQEALLERVPAARHRLLLVIQRHDLQPSLRQ